MTALPKDSQYTRRRKTVGIARLMQGVLTPAAKRHGFAQSAILADWPAIAGAELAACSRPIKLKRGQKHAGGTLAVKVSPAAILEMQHASPQIIERINGYFGYAAVRRLQLETAYGLTEKRRQPVRPKALTMEQDQYLQQTVEPIGEEPLRAAMLALGRAMLQNSSDQTETGK